MSELARLQWLCRRGMKELDIALTVYLEKYYLAADKEEQRHFRELLTLQDPALYKLVMQKTDSDERFSTIIQKIHHSIIS